MKAKLGLTIKCIRVLSYFLLSSASKSCVNHQKVNRDTISKEKKLLFSPGNSVSTQGFLCVETGSTHVVSAIPN